MLTTIETWRAANIRAATALACAFRHLAASRAILERMGRR